MLERKANKLTIHGKPLTSCSQFSNRAGDLSEMETEGFVQTDKAQRAAEEDEEDAEDWTDLERFQHFIASEHALRRLVCVRGLSETMKGVTCDEATSVALPLLESAAKDDESSVRDALASQLAPMLKALLSRAEPSEAEQIMALVWPVTLTLLRDRDQQVRAGYYKFTESADTLFLSL
jgi:hypothetical protein